MASIQTSIEMQDRISASLHGITNALNLTLTAFQGVQDTVSHELDADAFAGIREQINAATLATQQFENELSKIQSPTVEITPVWNTPQSIDIFQGNDIARYKQEVASATQTLNRLSTTQQNISQNASSMKLLPPQAVNDVGNMSNRIQALRNQIAQVQQSRIAVVGVERANAEVEGLRQKLNDAVQTQEALNAALLNMDVSAANAAYNQLNSIIDATERNIRDNTNEQQNFNQQLETGTKHASGLQNKIMGMTAAYLSIQGMKKVLDLSDTMAQTEARLNLIVDDGGSVQDLQNKIFASAQRARADFQTTSDVITKLGMQAGQAFSNNNELIAFSEQLNKTFKIAGTDASGIESTMYNLTQALASGVLRGQDLNAVFSNAQPIIQNIADYMGVSVGNIREIAAEGTLSAEIVKNAMFAAAHETNAKFEKIPKTFGDIAMGMKNNVVMAFQPILQKLNDIANSPAFETFTHNAITVFVTIAGVVMWAFDLIMSVASFISANWSLIAPIIYGVATALAIYAGYLAVTNGLELISKGIKFTSVILSYAKATATGAEVSATTAATAAQWGLNTALLSCPLTWIIIIIIGLIALVYIVVAAVNKFAGTSVSATGIIFGAFAVLGAFLWNLFLGLLDLVFGVINSMVNPFIRIANFIGNVFTSPVSSIIYLFQSMADGVLAILQKIASALDFVFGSNMADTIAGWRSGLKSMADAAVAKHAPNENYQNIMDELNLSVDSVGLKRWEYGDAWKTGYSAGENLQNSISNFDPSSLFGSDIPSQNDFMTSDGVKGIGKDTANIANNTEAIKNTGEQDLKYLRDIAERDAINKFTIAEINFDMGGVTNNVNSTIDLDGVAEYIGDTMMERLEIVAEGVYA